VFPLNLCQRCQRKDERGGGIVVGGLILFLSSYLQRAAPFLSVSFLGFIILREDSLEKKTME